MKSNDSQPTAKDPAEQIIDSAIEQLFDNPSTELRTLFKKKLADSLNELDSGANQQRTKDNAQALVNRVREFRENNTTTSDSDMLDQINAEIQKITAEGRAAEDARRNAQFGAPMPMGEIPDDRTPALSIRTSQTARKNSASLAPIPFASDTVPENVTAKTSTPSIDVVSNNPTPATTIEGDDSKNPMSSPIGAIHTQYLENKSSKAKSEITELVTRAFSSMQRTMARELVTIACNYNGIISDENPDFITLKTSFTGSEEQSKRAKSSGNSIMSLYDTSENVKDKINAATNIFSPDEITSLSNTAQQNYQTTLDYFSNADQAQELIKKMYIAPLLVENSLIYPMNELGSKQKLAFAEKLAEKVQIPDEIVFISRHQSPGNKTIIEALADKGSSQNNNASKKALQEYIIDQIVIPLFSQGSDVTAKYKLNISNFNDPEIQTECTNQINHTLKAFSVINTAIHNLSNLGEKPLSEERTAKLFKSALSKMCHEEDGLSAEYMTAHREEIAQSLSTALSKEKSKFGMFHSDKFRISDASMEKAIQNVVDTHKKLETSRSESRGSVSSAASTTERNSISESHNPLDVERRSLSESSSRSSVSISDTMSPPNQTPIQPDKLAQTTTPELDQIDDERKIEVARVVTESIPSNMKLKNTSIDALVDSLAIALKPHPSIPIENNEALQNTLSTLIRDNAQQKKKFWSGTQQIIGAEAVETITNAFIAEIKKLDEPAPQPPTLAKQSKTRDLNQQATYPTIKMVGDIPRTMQGPKLKRQKAGLGIGTPTNATSTPPDLQASPTPPRGGNPHHTQSHHH